MCVFLSSLQNECLALSPVYNLLVRKNFLLKINFLILTNKSER